MSLASRIFGWPGSLFSDSCIFPAPTALTFIRKSQGQHLAAQVGPYGIRANCIAPETILTERNQQLIPDELKRTLADQHPIKRLGTPEDVARAALFLASDDAAWLTGIIVDVAGGAVMG